MQITVYGATGTFGRRLVAHLREREHSVIAAHRGIGVDTFAGEGVTEAAEGSDVLVDCVNLMTNNRHKALDFFSRSSRSIALAAAENPGAAMVCLSIAFRPEVAKSKLLGYYQAKELQERVYRRLVPADQLLMFRSAQWFELVDTMTFSAGPVAFVPKMRVQALAADEAARMMAEAIDAGERGTIEVAGPEISDFPTIAGRIAAADADSAVSVGAGPSGGSRARGIPKIVSVPIPGPMSGNGLIPDSPRLSAVTVAEWIRSR
ncbi:SDR family oxidoreductase [Brevibacterium aurantiacum]|uniref:SDR family oxidoreductase n=1 Tax=Brevibacterium aurantiacum TaxID=273384 RepID=UPI00186852AD|nr:SDR family oxidoreductase [Brevibacterium aurantiacum]